MVIKRTTIIEGFALGEAFSQSNLPVTVYEGSEYVKFRMYEEGLRSLIQGWTKHFSVGANQTEPKVMLAIVMWLMGSLHLQWLYYLDGLLNRYR